ATPAEAAARAAEIGFPCVLKGTGAAHKTEAGLVALGLADGATVAAAAEGMDCGAFLIEEMIWDGVAELLIGVTHDPAHGFVLTLGAGGTLTEILDDSVSLLLPVRAPEVAAALAGLRIAPLLAGHRGKPAACRDSIVAAVMALQAFVTAHAGPLEEVEINPLICTPDRAVAADALIRTGEET
ncbi:acetate--CoA ligase family protein, partial [Roseovarius sp. SYSU LYC5161]|uniref:acetate--CoA ligase family protein n=1 Tax=Roseovarius halophilus (ex Wu et al. 2025) TaxID=3376060 RepID=UPI00399BA328